MTSKPHNMVLLGILFGLILVYPLSASASADPFAEQTFRAGFYAESFPDFSIEDIEISIKLLSEQIGADIGIETTITVYSDLSQMNRDFEAGHINFVVASSILLATQFDTQHFADGFRFVRTDGASDKVLVLSHKRFDKTELKDFQGKRLVLAQSDPMTELYIDYLALSTFKRGYKTSFKEVARERRAHQLLLKLFFNQADITCVYYNAYHVATELNPQLNEQLNVIAQIDGIPQGGGFFHVNTLPEFRERVIAHAQKLSEKPRGQQLLNLFKSDIAIRSTMADLLPALNLYDKHKQLASKR